MAIETAEDLEGFFHPDDFGDPMIAHMTSGAVPFNGILTTGHVSEQPGTSASISMLVPRIIASKASVAGLAQSDEIELQDESRVSVIDIQYKGSLVIIHYHEVW